MSVEPIQPLAFTIPDAVAYSGLSRSRLYTLIQAGELQSFRIGRRRMVLRERLESLIRSHAIEA